MTIKHDLEHEVYIDPKDGKEHTNHGMHEYTCLLYTSPSPRD